ncbi:hypothetical protein ACHWQZ_G005426 [Mnemiopsis leidyi]
MASSSSSIMFVLLLIISVAGSAYPNCTDPSTYTSYNKSTEYKGLSDTTAWDRSVGSKNGCDFSPVYPIAQPQTCGDCDFDLQEETWYRFDQGPYVEIAEYSDNISCPSRGHCNGFFQIALLSSKIDSGNDNSKIYHALYSNNSDLSSSSCIVSPDTFTIEEFYCERFRLYKFPSGWNAASQFCNFIPDGQGGILPTPYSLCMTDTVKQLNLMANRKYFDEVNTLLKCTSEQSPKPPADMMWLNQDNQDITSQAIKDETRSSLFTEVYSVNSSSFTSVTCQVDDKSHTFYRVSIQTENVTGIAGKEVTAICNFTMDEISSDNEEDFYFIKYLNDSEVYYTTANMSASGNRIMITKEESGTYRAAMDLKNTSVPVNLKTWTENWSCGLRDPVTGIYSTVSFTLTFTEGDTISKKLIYYLLVGGGAAILVVAIVVVVSCWSRSKRADRKAAQTVTFTDLDS